MLAAGGGVGCPAEIAGQDGFYFGVGAGELVVVGVCVDRGVPGRLLRQGGAVLVVDIHVDRGGESDEQGVPGELVGVEADADGQALDDFDPVAGGVLGGQNGKRAAGARLQAQHFAVVGDVGSVHVGG